jgi:RNA polymerase sigma-70 factor, ECF subfamily
MVDVTRHSPLQWNRHKIFGGVGERMPSETELIAKAKAGDRSALDELVAGCWQPLYHLIRRKTGSPEDAQDLAQETFFRAFRSLARYEKTETQFSTYLGQIALNLITDFWRKKGRTPPPAELADFQTAGDASSPEARLVSQERKATLLTVMQELPSEQRQVVELRILTGLPVKDTALAMNKTEAAVKMLQQRALKSLREKLLERGVIERP